MKLILNSEQIIYSENSIIKKKVYMQNYFVFTKYWTF